jgi:hypothetical protein
LLSRGFRLSKTPIIKKAFDKNPRRTTGSRSDPRESLLFHAVTTPSGFILLSEIRGFFERYLR